MHPWFLVILGNALLFGGGLAPNRAQGGDWLVGPSVFKLLAGYATAMALGALAVTPEIRRVAWQHVLVMPVYWVAISFAAYRALWQLAFAPFLWEKTTHHERRFEQSGNADIPPIDGWMSKISRAR